MRLLDKNPCLLYIIGNKPAGPLSGFPICTLGGSFFEMNKIPYTKPPLTVQEHIELLKTRGLQISSEEGATRSLQNISYFHLSGYMYPFLRLIFQMIKYMWSWP